MARTEAEPGKTEYAPPFNLGSPELAAAAEKRLAALAGMQSEFMEGIRAVNQRCVERVQAETKLAADLVAKLADSHSVADTTAAWQEWGSRRMQLVAEDGKRLVADGQRLMEQATRLLANGWLPKGPASGS